MTMLSFPIDILARIVAIHDAAADQHRSSHALECVGIRQHDDKLTIFASDGKILMEEVWTVDAGKLPGEAELLLGPDAVSMIAGWIKLARKALGKRATATVEFELYPNRTAAARLPGLPLGECFMRLRDGSHIRYEHALRPTDKPEGKPLFGLDMAYMARLSAAWKVKGRDTVPVSASFHRGIILRPLAPLPPGCVSSLALVMPITLPS